MRVSGGGLGAVPLYNDMVTRGKYLNVLYQYAVAGVRYQREGNIGPALIDVSKAGCADAGYWTYNPLSLFRLSRRRIKIRYPMHGLLLTR